MAEVVSGIFLRDIKRFSEILLPEPAPVGNRQTVSQIVDDWVLTILQLQ
jgi:hypothetical protein